GLGYAVRMPHPAAGDPPDTAGGPGGGAACAAPVAHGAPRTRAPPHAPPQRPRPPLGRPHRPRPRRRRPGPSPALAGAPPPVLLSFSGADASAKTKGQTLAALRAAVGLPPNALAAAPAAATAGRVATEVVRARPGRCVGVITGGRRCGRAAPPGDPPLCSFCR